MQYTLLELIQRILSSIKGEEIDSYDDTAESLVVRDIVKECFYNIVSLQDFPELKTLFELTASGNSAKPTLMVIPSDVLGVEWVKYNKKEYGATDDDFQYVRYVPLKDFLDQMHELNASDAEVGTFNITTGASDSIEILYRNDGHPNFYTTFDDNQILFDSYDATVDTTLQKSKSLGFGLKGTSWVNSNTFVPPLDAQQFNILLKEAKAMAWEELRQTANPTAAMQTRRAKIAAEKKKDRLNYNHKGYYDARYPNYGRK